MNYTLPSKSIPDIPKDYLEVYKSRVELVLCTVRQCGAELPMPLLIDTKTGPQPQSSLSTCQWVLWPGTVGSPWNYHILNEDPHVIICSTFFWRHMGRTKDSAQTIACLLMPVRASSSTISTARATTRIQNGEYYNLNTGAAYLAAFLPAASLSCPGGQGRLQNSVLDVEQNCKKLVPQGFWPNSQIASLWNTLCSKI